MFTKPRSVLTLFAASVVALCALSTTASAALVGGQSIGIDFASTGSTAGMGLQTNFNLVSGIPFGGNANVTDVGTLDTTGGSTNGVTLSVTGINNVMGGETDLGFGGIGIGDYGSFPFKDASFNDGVWSVNEVVVTLKGLDNSLTYNVLALAAGPIFQDGTPEKPIGKTNITVDGTTTLRTYLSFRANNVLNPVSFSGVSTDGNGNLVIKFSVPPGIGAFGLNAVHVTAVAKNIVIPTPAALPAGLALLGLAAMRRRRRS